MFPLRIKNNIKLIPNPLPKIDFKILVSPYTFGLSQPGEPQPAAVGEAAAEPAVVPPDVQAVGFFMKNWI